MTTAPEFDPNVALFVGLAQFVAARDGITVDEASTRLADLFNTPEVQAQVEADRAASPEVKLVEAEVKIADAKVKIADILASL